MKSHSSDDPERLRRQILGLGEASIHKSHYPTLRLRLRELERFRALLDLSSDLLFIVELPSGRILDVNQEVVTRLELTKEVLLDQVIGSWLPAFDSHLSSGDHISSPREPIETTLRIPSGELPVEVVWTVMNAGTSTFGLLSARDISPRKRMEDQQARQLNVIRALVDGVPAFAFFKDREFRYRRVNRYFVEQLGWPEEMILGKSDYDLFPKEVADRFRRFDQSVVDSGVASTAEEWIEVEGRTICCVATKTPFYDAVGGVAGLVGVSFDVSSERQVQSALREAKEAAEAAAEAKTRFLLNMSHEIRTPLNGALGMTELALGTSLTPEQREYLESSQESTRHLLRILNDVLDLERVSIGRLELLPEAFAPAALVEKTVVPFRVQAAKKKVEFVYAPHAGLPAEVFGDAGRIRQILENLLGNALKFTNAGSVEVGIESTKQTDDTAALHFWVRDTGIGIPRERVEHIFDPFYQVDSSSTREYGGVGLGLSIVSELVKLMGGEIWVDSELGRGSAFHFSLTLPLSAARKADAPVSETGGALADVMKSLRVLVVEDNPVNQRYVAGILQKQGGSYAVASDGDEALQMLQKEDFDLVLMDLLMPARDGYETTRMIRKREQQTGQHVPIVALTASVVRGEREKCLAAGMDEYLGKPFSVRELVDVVSRALDCTP